MVTLCLNVGRKDKIRPGDILGALTQDAGLSGDMVGKIDITSLYSYVAIHHSQVDVVTHYLQKGKLKGRKVSLKSLL
jgi:ATP-independent RNA helicase DbpA